MNKRSLNERTGNSPDVETSLTTTVTIRSKFLNPLPHEALEPAAETADT
jgi:hypothetical protein